jgi:hypothetical protein
MAAAPIYHVEVVGKDGKALQRYYSDLFGWQFDTSNPGGYGITDPSTTGVAVGIGSTQDGSSGHVTGYVKVADINATLAKVTELGGSVVMPRFSPDGSAHLALFADPEGHVIGLTE